MSGAAGADLGNAAEKTRGKSALSVDQVQVSVLALLFWWIGEDGDDAPRPVSARQCAGPGQVVDVNRIRLKGRGGNSCRELLILNLLQFN